MEIDRESNLQASFERHSLPTGNELSRLLDLQWGSQVEELMQTSLLNPLGEFINRGSKRIRGRILEMGFEMVPSSHVGFNPKGQTSLKVAMELLELIHGASLVIDDIQDNSELRRGEPTLHKKMGVGSAINAGNWLYFWPLLNIEKWDLKSEDRTLIYELCHRSLLKAHFGQALDVSTDIFSVPQSKIQSIVLASLELKSGALMNMAFLLGGLLAGADQKLQAMMQKFAVAFGISLQMFDDAGNAANSGPKQYEDLSLHRPSWVVAVAAQGLGIKDFERFSESIKFLPDATQLSNYLLEFDLISEARVEAKSYLQHALIEFEIESQSLGCELNVVKRVNELAQELVEAYG